MYTVQSLQSISKLEKPFTKFMSYNYSTFIWKESKALGIPTFTSHRVQLEVRIEKLLQGCLLSLLISGNASQGELDDVKYQCWCKHIIEAASLQSKTFLDK